MDLERQGLENYVKACAWLLLIGGLLPFDFYGQVPIWPWHGLADASLFDVLALLTPLVGAGALFLVGSGRRTKVGLAAGLLAGTGLAWLVGLWAELSPHPLQVYGNLTDGLPALFSRSFWLLLSGMILLGAGLRLGARGFLDVPEGRSPLVDPWPLARVLILGGVLATVAFYILPYRGSVPVLDLVSGVVELMPQLQDAQGLAFLSGHVLSIGPLLFALAGLWRVFVRPQGYGGGLAGFALGYIPVLCLLVGLRNLPVLPAYTLIHLRSASLILATTLGGGLALAALLRALWYEIPWVFGRLTLSDDMLAAALSSPDPAGSLKRMLAQLSPLVRPFVRRRLALWRVAAVEVPSAEATDLSAVIRFLEMRWSEEQAGQAELDALTREAQGEESPDQSIPDSRAPRWPWWLKGWVPTSAALVLLLAPVLISLAQARRADPGEPWLLDPDRPELSRLFTQALPETVLDLASAPGPYLDRAAYKELLELMALEEERVPGISSGLIQLLELGSKGRYRIHRIRRARDELNRLLQRQRVPYYLRSRVRSRGEGQDDLFYLLVYRIEACGRYSLVGAEQVFAVLQLQRADPLNVVESYMGMTEEEETFVTVFLGRLEYFMAQRLQGVLDRQDRIGALARRSLGGMGVSLDSFEDGLDSAAGRRLLEGLTRHELHHRWMGLNPSPPTVIWKYMFGYSADSVRGVTAEIGAYLGEMAYHASYARLRLTLMLDALEGRAGRQGAHGRARAFLVRRILEMPLEPDLSMSYYEFEQAVGALERVSDEVLMEGLDRVHSELFGVPVPRFERL